MIAPILYAVGGVLGTGLVVAGVLKVIVINRREALCDDDYRGEDK